MKPTVLLAHNHYNSALPSGEEQVLRSETELLRDNGHVVHEFYRSSDDLIRQGVWGKLRGGFATPWNPFTARAMQKAVDDLAPQVVHVHNTFPLLSPSIFHAIGHRAARVLTLHNYRLFCPAAIPLRDGKVCTQCIDQHSVGPALRYGCYRNSHVATAPIALGVALHRLLKTWTQQVDAFIVFTQFQRDRMIKAGLPPERVHVKPNFYPGEPAVIPWEERQPRAVYVGRLTPEKGVETLLRAWLAWGPSAPELNIVGEGELRPFLMELAATSPGVRIRFSGRLESDAARAEIARSQMLVLPSQWLEGFPLVLCEAFAHGTPVAVSDIGPLPLIVQSGQNGVVFTPGDPQDLCEVVKAAWETPAMLRQLSSGARRSFRTLYTGGTNYRMLMQVYQSAIEANRQSERG